MSESDTLLELLIRYEDARDHGALPTPEEVCIEHPELIEVVRERINDLEEFDRDFCDRDTLPMPARVRASFPEKLVIAGYVIRETIGRGGTAVVYRALQPGLNREVALKMLNASDSVPATQRARFRLEAEAIARLRHPNIVQIFQIGEHEGSPFLALEYCRGGNLARRLREGGTMSPREAALCVRDLARGIEAAHAVGIIHRDLKPANVLCEERGFCITDFGLAQDQAGPREREGTVAGTPAYMAPEQAEGRTRDIGTHTDIYALGAVLYECLTGRPPHLGLTVSDTLGMVRRGDPPRPRELRKDIPQDLETICLKCLEKDPAQRYASAAGLREDLDRYLDGRPVLARPVGPLGRAWRFCKRYPVQVGLAVAVILSLAIGTTAATLFGVEAGRQAKDARDERDRANTLAEEKSTLAREKSTLAEERRLALERAERERERAAVRLYASQLESGYAGWRRGDLLGGYPRPTTERPGGAVMVDPDRPVAGSGLRDLLGRTAWEYQDWEHHFLAGLAEPRGPVLLGLAARPTVTAFSPDGKLLAVGGGVAPPVFGPTRSGVVQFFDATSGELLRSVLDLDTVVADMVFHPDGREILVATAIGTVRRIEVDSGHVPATLPGPGQPTTGLAYLGPGRAVQIGFGQKGPNQAPSGAIVAWDLATGRPLYRLADELPCFALAAAPDGETFYTAEARPDGSGRVAVRAGATGKVLREWATPRPLARLLLMPDQGVLVSSVRRSDQGREGEPAGWDVVTGAVRYRLDAGVAVAPAGPGRFFTLAFGGELRLWDAASGREIGRNGEAVRAAAPLAWAGAAGADLVAHPDGTRVAIVDRLDRLVYLLDTTRDPQFRRLRGRLAAPLAGGDEVALVGADDRLRRLRLSDGPWLAAERESIKELEELALPRTSMPAPITDLALSPDGKRLAIATGDRADMNTRGSGEVQLWDPGAAKLLRRLTPRGNPVVTLAWSPDGNLLAGLEAGSGLSVWDVEAGTLLHGVAGAPYNPGSLPSRGARLAFSADGRTLALDTSRGRGRLLDARSGRLEREFAPLYGPAELTFLEDDKQILAAGGYSALWNRETGSLIKNSREQLHLFVLAYDAPRRLLAGAGQDGVIQVRELFAPAPASGGGSPRDPPVRLLEPAGGSGRVRSLAFAADGKTLAGAFGVEGNVPGGAPGVVLWDVLTGKIRRRLDGLTSLPHCVLFAPDGTVLAGTEEGQVIQWDAETGEVKRKFTVEVEGRPVLVALDSMASTNRVVAATRAGELLCWTAGSGGQPRSCGRLPGIATAFALAPDGRLVVGAGGGPTTIPAVDFSRGWLAVHDLESGREVWQQADTPGQGAPGLFGRERVAHLAFSAKGDRILTLVGPLLQRARSLEVRATKTGALLHRIDGPGQQLTGVTGHPDGRRALVLGERGSVLEIDLEAGSILRVFGGEPGGPLAGLAVNKNGTRIFAGAGYPAGPGPHLVVWETATGDRLLSASSRNASPVAASTQRLWLSHDGRNLAMAGVGELAIWEAGSGPPQRRIEGTGVACWAADGQTLVTSGDAQGAVWSVRDVTTGKELRALHGQKGEAVAAIFLPRGGLVTLASSPDGSTSLAVWDGPSAATKSIIGTGKSVAMLPLGWRKASAMAVHPTSSTEVNRSTTRVAVAGVAQNGHGVLSVRALPEGNELLTREGHASAILAVAWSPDGKQLVSAGADGLVLVRDGETGAEVRKFHLAGAARCLVFVGPDRLLIGGGGPHTNQEGGPDARPVRGELVLANLTTGEVVPLAGPMRPVTALTLSPDARWLVSATAGGLETRDELRLHDLTTNRVRWTMPEVGAIRSLAFQPGGWQLLVGTNRRIAIHDLGSLVEK
jgi:WD40 repeat protein